MAERAGYGLTIGGGGGFTLGPAQNVFTGADRTAAETALDDYDTANPGWITAYNADVNLNIRLEYADSGDQLAVYQVRNGAGSTWLDNSSAIGVKGDSGAAGGVYTIVENSGNYTVAVGDDYVANTGPSVVTLPATASAVRPVTVKSVLGGGTVTLTPNGLETIDGAATQAIVVNAAITVFPVTAGWLIA